jgi:hypothetical protein
MILWIDAQLSPALAPWIQEQFGIETYPVRSLGLRNATDRDIFQFLKQYLPEALKLLESGEALVEISDIG